MSRNKITVIWKYPVRIGITQYQLPEDANIFVAQEQLNRPQMWVMLDPENSWLD